MEVERLRATLRGIGEWRRGVNGSEEKGRWRGGGHPVGIGVLTGAYEAGRLPNQVT